VNCKGSPLFSPNSEKARVDETSIKEQARNNFRFLGDWAPEETASAVQSV
jgi:predicted small lipoprotein YifL